MDELYGSFSLLTQEWTDGLASTIIRNFVERQHTDMKWVVFDGPVDSLWIENMNTVLDDNQTLCLSNGERIRLKPEMRMIFEIDDLSGASPATVSRCGMVYSAPETCHWSLIANRWIETLPTDVFTDKIKVLVKALFDQHIELAFETMQKNSFREVVPTSPNGLVISLCRLFEAVLRAHYKRRLEGEYVKRTLARSFIFALAWSFGGTLDACHHSKFETYLSTDFNISDLPKGSVFDYELVLKGN